MSATMKKKELFSITPPSSLINRNYQGKSAPATGSETEHLQRMADDFVAKKQVVTGIQAKLQVSRSGDAAEIEADSVADQVVNGEFIAPGKVSRKSNGIKTMSVTEETAGQVNNISGGAPLSESDRSYFEPRFGTDFSNVRIHTDDRADHMAQSINAKAFTKGNDIVFAKGHYQPGGNTGKKLLAHELAHVVQGGKGIFRDENTNHISPEYITQLTAPQNEVIEDDFTRRELLTDYKINARKLLQFKLDTLYQWINIVTRAQITGPSGGVRREIVEELQTAAITINGLDMVARRKKSILDTTDSIIRLYVPPEGHPNPSISGQSTIGARDYMLEVFDRENLSRFGYPNSAPGFLEELDSLGFRPAVTEEEITAHILRYATNEQLLDAGWRYLKYSGQVRDFGPFAEPRYEWQIPEPSDDEIIEIGRQHIHEDETLRLHARLALDMDPERTADPEELSVLDREAVHPAYNWDALRFVAQRIRNRAEMDYLTAREALEVKFDEYPLLRMYVSNWNIFLNEFFEGDYENLINVNEISSDNVLAKLDKLLEEITTLKSKISRDDGFLFDTAVQEPLTPLIQEYTNVNPDYGEWINDRFSSRQKWNEALDTLLTIAGIVGFLLAEVLSMGWATLAVTAGAGAFVGLAVRSQQRASVLNLTAHVGFSPREEAALAEFKAWLDTALAAISVGQAVLRGIRFFRFHYTYLRHGTDAAGKVQSIVNGIDPQYLNPNSRFGPGFYVTKHGETALAELTAHNVTGRYMIRFRVNIFGERILNLSDPIIAARWGFEAGVTSTAACQRIASQALSQGYNVIVFSSYRGAGLNYVIYSNFDKILVPLNIAPIP